MDDSERKDILKLEWQQAALVIDRYDIKIKIFNKLQTSFVLVSQFHF